YVRDPLELAAGPLVLTPHEFYLITLLDGNRSLRDIKLEFARKFGGVLLPDEQLQEIINALDAGHYLDTEGFREHFRRIQEEFRQAPVRVAWHARQAYPDDPEQLRQLLDGFYEHPRGAGKPFSASEGTASPFALPDNRRLTGILAPHIDLRVGGPCYTHAYRYLIENSDADLYIILGVAHYGGEGFFITTTKDFETPLGTVPTDREFVQRWMENAGEDLTREEWAHRIEHSIEFQLPFLQHGLGRPFSIVPVLCGHLEPPLSETGELSPDPRIAGLIESLGTTIAQTHRRVAFILSVDLAHMGPKFGDPRPITPEDQERIREADQIMFDVVSRLEREAFAGLMRYDLLPRRVDACAAVYTFLSLMPEGEGRLVAYDQNFQEDTGSLVSYGSMIFVSPK
ncbi:MAG: AmmeMemoRadiSam system protein B, partial [Calditrichaeota bacterium]